MCAVLDNTGKYFMTLFVMITVVIETYSIFDVLVRNILICSLEECILF